MKLDDIYQSREFKSLEDIFSNDSLGIFANVKPISKERSRNNSLLEQQFSEINSFIDMNGRLPSEDAIDFNEKILSRRLSSIKNQASIAQELLSIDKHGLLTSPQSCNESDERAVGSHIDQINQEPLTNQDGGKKERVEVKSTIEPPSFNSLEDIFNNDALGIFDNIQSDILISDSQKNVRSRYDQYDDEDIASRFECKDFYNFEMTFERINQAIQAGEFTKTNFASTKNITIGSVFVLNGLLCYVADIYKAEVRKNSRSQERLRLIFANGTESNMLVHSLATAQYKYENSYQLLITAPDWIDAELAKSFGDNSQLTGVIYVAKLTDTPENLKHYKHLHKIGFSTLTGDKRTKHSTRDNAFLQQPVDIIAEWQVYDANARAVESVLHAFFYDQRVRVLSKAKDDNFHNATEWFDVALQEIEKAINLVIAGDIKDYRIDRASGVIVPK